MDKIEALFLTIMAVAVVGILVAFGASIYECATQEGGCQVESPSETTASGDDGVGGIGMSYRGRLGVEIAPGLVMEFDGTIGPGF